MDNLTDRIREAIKTEENQLAKIRADQNTVMPVLQAARYVDTSTVNLIASRYEDKKQAATRSINDMRFHLQELEAANA